MTTRATRLAPLTGLLFVGLFVASIAVGGKLPTGTAKPSEVIAFYTSHRRAVQLSSFLQMFAMVAGLFFFGTLRAFLRRDNATERLASICFSGGILLAASGCIGAGTKLALAHSPKQLLPATAQTLNLLRSDMHTFLTAAGVAVLMFASGLAILRSGLAAAWLGWLSLAIGLLGLIAGPVVLLIVVLWAVALSVVMLRQGTPTPRSDLPV